MRQNPSLLPSASPPLLVPPLALLKRERNKCDTNDENKRRKENSKQPRKKLDGKGDKQAQRGEINKQWMSKGDEDHMERGKAQVDFLRSIKKSLV